MYDESPMQLVTSSSMIRDQRGLKPHCLGLGLMHSFGCDLSTLVVPSEKSPDGQNSVYAAPMSIAEVPNVPSAALMSSGNKFQFYFRSRRRLFTVPVC